MYIAAFVWNNIILISINTGVTNLFSIVFLSFSRYLIICKPFGDWSFDTRQVYFGDKISMKTILFNSSARLKLFSRHRIHMDMVYSLAYPTTVLARLQHWGCWYKLLPWLQNRFGCCKSFFDCLFRAMFFCASSIYGIFLWNDYEKRVSSEYLNFHYVEAILNL